MSLPLTGVKILDLTRLLPGPFATLILADLGADVLKVEDPKLGDYIRMYAPFINKQSAYFLSINRNKKSMHCNLKAPEGKEVFIELVKKSDVLIESFRPGVMARLGLGFDELLAHNPSLVYCAITGYGQDGPYRDRAGHDLNYISIAGISHITGYKSERPAIPGTQIADIGGGALYSVVSVLAALQMRNRDGKGRFLDVSMTDGALSFLIGQMIPAFVSGVIPQREEARLTGMYPCYQIYETKDGKFMSLGALEDKFWAEFCHAVGREDLVEHAFPKGEKRDEVIGEVKGIFRQRTQEEWIGFFREHDCCCEPVLDFRQVREHPQIAHRDLFFVLEHPEAGSIDQVRTPVRISGCDRKEHSPPPGFGQHTEEILRELGYDEAGIARLREKGAI